MRCTIIQKGVVLFAVLAIGAISSPPNAVADAKNNTLVIGIASEPLTLDPAMGVAGTDYPYLYTLYERILRFDPKTLEPQPGLAEPCSPR